MFHFCLNHLNVYLCKKNMTSIDSLRALASFILPSELSAYFDVSDVHSEYNELHISLDEQPVVPSGYESWEVRSNGFFPEVLIRDFPIRDRKVFLHVRRRRWIVLSTNESTTRHLSLTAEGTRYTEEFASFLKEMLGFIPDYGPLS